MGTGNKEELSFIIHRKFIPLWHNMPSQPTLHLKKTTCIWKTQASIFLWAALLFMWNGHVYTGSKGANIKYFSKGEGLLGSSHRLLFVLWKIKKLMWVLNRPCVTCFMRRQKRSWRRGQLRSQAGSGACHLLFLCCTMVWKAFRTWWGRVLLLLIKDLCFLEDTGVDYGQKKWIIFQGLVLFSGLKKMLM